MAERKINLFDLLIYILSHWRSILVCMLIGALLMGGFSYVRSYQSAEKAQAERNVNKTVDEQLQSQERLLSETEKASVHVVIDYEKEYALYQQYMENSVLMQMDPSNIPTVEMIFRIQADDVEQAHVLRTIYKDLINGMGMFRWVEEQTGIPSAGASELITAQREADILELDSAQRVGLGNTSQKVVVIHDGETAIGNDSLKVVVIHYDEAECEKLAQCVKDYIAQQRKQLARELGVHDVVLLTESAGTVMDTRVLDKQMQYTNNVITILNNLGKTKDTFTANQQKYYTLLKERESSGEVEEIGEVEEVVEEPQTVVIKPSISKKYVAIGAVGFAFVYAGVLLVIYVLSGKLRAADELQELYNISQLGLIVKDDGKKRFFIDRWIDALKNWNKRRFTREQSLDLAAAAIKISAGQQELDTVFLMGCDLKAGAGIVCQELKERLQEDNIAVKILDNVLYDAGTMEELESAKGIVLVEKAMSTMYDEILRELELASRQGIKVLGGIVVE